MKHTLAAAAFALSALAPTASHADVAITVDGGWYEFYFNDVGSSFEEGAFTFTLTDSALLRVTDAWLAGDQFEVFNFGQSLGATPLVAANINLNVNDDYDAAFASPGFSHGSWLLGPGTYSITGTTLVSPFGGGGGAISLVSAVPEPSTLMLALTGLALAGVASRRRAG